MVIIQEEKLGIFPSKFDSIKKEVVDSAKDDWKRKEVDDAKKRAIYNSRNYDDFKQLVAGCTLKPIGKNEFNAPAKRKLMNRHVAQGSNLVNRSQASSDNPAPPRSGGAIGESISDKIKTLPDFEKHFRRSNGALGQWKFMAQLDPARFEKIFRPEIDGQLLSEMFVCLHAGIEEEEQGLETDPQAVLERLHGLVTLPSAEFALNFMMEADRKTCRQILKACEDADKNMMQEISKILEL